MPLDKSGTKAAFKSNIKSELASGRAPKQAVAIAYSVKREAKKGKVQRNPDGSVSGKAEK